MKRFRHFLLATGVGVVVFASELGCVFDNEPFRMAEAAQTGEEAVQPKLAFHPTLPAGDIEARELLPHFQTEEPGKNPAANDPTEPNSIILETCEPDPDEVAVPLNVEEGKECHKVHAQGIFADAHSVTKTAVKFTWSIDDNSVASIVGYPDTKHDSSVELEAKSDIFSEPGLTGEPKTTLTVCAEPVEGWHDKSHPELCRSLPVYAVVNAEGSWCFKGAYFTPDPGADCHSIFIAQDGRFLTIEQDDHGTIYEKQFDFHYDNLEYRSTQSTSTTMSGIVLAGNDVEGSFEAFRLPL